jgi:hypothetical protein
MFIRIQELTISYRKPLTASELVQLVNVFQQDQYLDSSIKLVFTVKFDFNKSNKKHSMDQILLPLNEVKNLTLLSVKTNVPQSFNDFGMHTFRELTNIHERLHRLCFIGLTINRIGSAAFSLFRNLLGLRFQCGLISKLDVDAFKGLTKLTDLSLHRCGLEDIDKGTLCFLESLNYLDLLIYHIGI